MTDILLYYPWNHEEHFEIGHPERPERVEAIRDGLIQLGWWNEFKEVEPIPIPEDVLFSIHSREYLETLKSTCSVGRRLDPDTYTTHSSWQLALNASGGAVSIADKIWNSNPKKSLFGLALTRPPGHHATRNRGMGFCLLNNVALTAEYLIKSHKVDKIMIVDFDLHHGNGTQDIFWEREDVFYISTHQYPFYPGTGRIEQIGKGRGEGYTANFPLPPGTGDTGFLSITEEFILPIIDQYRPGIVLISYGFDPHWRDPLGHLQLSATGYSLLIQKIKDWVDIHCAGRMALFLEGGYDLQAASACTNAIISSITGKIWEDPIGPSPNPEGKSWIAVASKAREIWKF